jgi:hypothetical protein
MEIPISLLAGVERFFAAMKIFQNTQRFDWKSTIKLNLVMMRIVGLWPRGESYRFDFYTVYALLSVNVFITGQVIFHTVDVFMVGRDLKNIIGALYMSLTETLLMVKLFSFIKNSRKLKELMRTLDSDAFQPKSAEQTRLVEPELHFWKRVHRAFALLVGNTVFLFISLPILSRSTKQHRLPVEAWYPFDTTKSPFYELTYFYQFLSILFRGLSSVSMDTFIAALNTYIGAQCTILCDDLKNLRDSPDVSFNRKLVECIKHHKLIVRFAFATHFRRRFDFQFSVLLEIVTSSITASSWDSSFPPRLP